MFRKILIGFFSALILFVSSSLLATKAYAQESTWYHQPWQEWYDKVTDTSNPEEIFGERYTAAQVEWVIYGFIKFIMDALGDENLLNCVIQNSSDLTPCADEFINAISYQPQGQASFLAVVTARPLSSLEYFKDVGKRLKLIPEVQAQAPGYGFTAANAVLELWKMVRNVTFGLLVFAIIVIAFMIMFRVKISPQTVITVQSALPKVVIALILITFSYAIAGFLIDLMYVVIGIIAAILTGSDLTTWDWGTMYGALTNERTVMSLMGYYFITFIVASFLALASNPLGALHLLSGATWIVWIILVVLMLIVLLIATFKIWFMLIKTFVSVLLLIITSPILILLGALGYGGFGSWLTSMAANLAVFPMVGFMFFLAFVFLGGALPRLGAVLTPLAQARMPFNVNIAVLGNSTWIPPLTFGTQDLDILWLVVSVVIITLIPKAADIIKGLISGKPLPYGTAAGAALAAPLAAAWGWGPVREYREQAGALGAYRMAQAFEKRFIPASMREDEKSLWNIFMKRLERRGGFGGA